MELIRAFHEINRKDIELVFVGGWDEEYKRECERYIKEHTIASVSFTGNVENPWDIVTDKDICVFTSSLETYGLVYVEALLNGIPVIISDNPGHLSAYEMFQHGKIYPLGNIDSLVEAINYFIDNFEEVKSKSEMFIKTAKEKYQIKSVYHVLIERINQAKTNEHAIRHIKNLLVINEKKSKLANLEIKIRSFVQRVMYKIKNK